MKAGDLVMLVWACCWFGRRHLGWVGTIEAIEDIPSSRCSCGHVSKGDHAYVTIDRYGVIPLCWLKKIDPPYELASIDKDQTVLA